MLPFPKKKLVDNIKDKKASVRAGIESMKIAQDSHLDVPKQDLIPNTQYSDRILDALARIFHGVSLPCTAVCIVEDTLYVTYSVTGTNIATLYPKATTKAQKIHASLKFTIDNNKTYVDFRNWLLREEHKFYLSKEIFDNEKSLYIDETDLVLQQEIGLRKEIEDFLNLKGDELVGINVYYDSLINNLNTAYGLDNHKLKTIINYIDSAKSKMVYLKDRIDQDCYKIVKYYGSYGIANLKLEFVPNPGNLHAELNLRQKFAMNSGYIGISKLSCFLCDIFLKHEEELYGGNLHLGGHGIAFPMQNNDLPEMLFDEERKPVIDTMFSLIAKAYRSSESSCYSVDNAMQYPPLSPRNEGLNEPWDPNVFIIPEDYSLTALGDNAEANCAIH